MNLQQRRHRAVSGEIEPLEQLDLRTVAGDQPGERLDLRLIGLDLPLFPGDHGLRPGEDVVSHRGKSMAEAEMPMAMG